MHRDHNQMHCWIKIPVVLALITQTFEHEQLSHNSVRVKLQHWPGMESSVSTTAVAALFCHLPTGAWREENSEYTMKYTTGTYPCPKLFCTDYSDTWVSE